MNKSKIEWLKNPDGSQGFSINPIKGLCPKDCKDLEGKSYCYARKMYRRFRWNETIRFDAKSLSGAIDIGKPSRIFVGSTMELFGDWVKPSWLNFILKCCELMPEHTFIFLTKCPQNLAKWSFSPNCWVGVSATDESMFHNACYYLEKVTASVKFISFEPLLSFREDGFNIERLKIGGITWVILGSKTQPVKHPPKEWCREIISAADKAGIPIFVKSPLAEHLKIDRKEFPYEKN